MDHEIFSVTVIILLSVSLFSANADAQTGLVSHWKFDEGSGTIATDSSGNGNDGAIYQAKWVGGKIGAALEFDGLDDSVSVPSSPSIEPASITIESWVYLYTLKSSTIGHKWFSGEGGYSLSVMDDGRIHFVVGGAPNTWNPLDSDVTLNPNEWTHVVATFDDSTKQSAVYINNVSKSTTFTGMSIVHATKGLEIGVQWSNQAPLHGIIDEVAIYDRAITPEEVGQHYSQGLQTKPKVSGTLLNKTGSPMQSQITVYEQGTENVVASSQTDANGDYSIELDSDVYDIEFGITDFFIPDYEIKIPSVNVYSNVEDLISQLTTYTGEMKVSFSIDIDEPRAIQINSEKAPIRVLQDGAEMESFTSLQLKNTTWFYQDDTVQRLHILATPWPVPVCRNDIGDCEVGEDDMNNPYYCVADCPPKCSDGTNYEECSDNKPKLCDNGVLVDSCNQCGCHSGYWAFACLGDDTCNYSQHFVLGFEDAADFETTKQAPVWNGWGTDWVMGAYPDDLYFEPTTGVFYSGSQSANLTLVDPTQEATRRMEILHDFDSRTIKEVWLQTMLYIPEGTPVDGFLTIHRSTYERLWNGTSNSLPDYQWFQFPLGVVIDGRSSQPTYQKPILTSIICQGEVDNNRDGLNDLTNDPYASSYNVHSPFEVPFGEWINITSYTYKDMQNGTYRVWYNGQLLWDVHPVRTIGVDPEKMMALYGNPGSYHSYNSIGISLYTSLPASPKTIYIDDVIIKLEKG